MAFYASVERDLQNQLRLRLSSQGNLITHLVEEHARQTQNLKEAAQLALTAPYLNLEMRVRIADPSGEIVFDSDAPGKPSDRVDEQSLKAIFGDSEVRWSTHDGFHDALPIHGLDGAIGILEISAPRGALAPVLDVLNHELLKTSLLASGIGILLSFLLVMTLIKPIRELETVALQLAKGSRSTRAPFKRNDEIGSLAKAIDTMAYKIEEQLKQIEGEKTTLQAVLSSMIDGLIVLDKERRIQFLNPQAERSLRVKSQKVAGQLLETVWPLRDVNELVADGLTQTGIASREIALPYNVLKLFVIPIDSVTGAAALLIFRDITEVRRLEDLRNQFLGQVSHELRTPLTIMKGYVVTLLDDPRLSDAPNDIKKILFRVEEEADRLTKLVEELLELSRLKSGRSALTFAPVDVKVLVVDTLEGMKAHANRYRIQFKLETEGTIPSVLGDTRGLRRVFLNLIDNAIKYSKRESLINVLISGSKEAVTVKIIDEGSGIPKEDLPHVFERFFQGKKKSEGKGWGLGLPIVKEIVEGHDGKIRIESIEEKGTSVTVTLPAEGLQVEERKS